MFGSYCTPPTVQFGGSVCAIGAAGIGHSPPTESAWSLERYGQNVTASESEMPTGQLASGDRVAVDRVLRDRRVEGGRARAGDVRPDRRAGRRQRDRAGAQAPVVVLGGDRRRRVAVVPSSVVLRTPNALSAMLLLVIVDARRADEAHAAAEVEVLVVLGVVAERVRVVVRRRGEHARRPAHRRRARGWTRRCRRTSAPTRRR